MRYILGSLILVVAMSGAALACSDTDTKALEAFDHAWGSATVSGNRAALMDIYADDFTGLPGMQSKTAAIDAAMKAAEHMKGTSEADRDKVTYDHYLIACTGNSATITHRNTIWTKDGTGGKPETFWTRSVHFLEKRGGKWVVVSNAGGALTDDAQLWYLEQDWNDAQWKKDKSWFDTHFANDFSSISSMDGKLTNKEEEIAGLMGDKSTYDLIETKNMEIRVEGNTAVINGIYHLKGHDDKGAFDRNIRYTDTWIKRDGQWQAWASQGTFMK